MGLVVVTPYLCESDNPDAEVIHPLDSVFNCKDLSLVAEDAALRMLPDQFDYVIEKHDFVLPVRRHIGDAAVVGIAQTRYRPKTSLTAAGKAHHIDRISAYRDAYEQMGVEQDWQYQGYIKVESR
jgi:LAS superfamily LD-carboxypeptidase LdcB